MTKWIYDIFVINIKIDVWQKWHMTFLLLMSKLTCDKIDVQHNFVINVKIDVQQNFVIGFWCQCQIWWSSPCTDIFYYFFHHVHVIPHHHQTKRENYYCFNIFLIH
jgi:hypothetical protein